MESNSVYRVTPKSEGRILWMGVEADIVYIICPICDGDRVEMIGDNYECCACGMIFKTEYKEE